MIGRRGDKGNGDQTDGQNRALHEEAFHGTGKSVY
jgi:hypothetical protein